MKSIEQIARKGYEAWFAHVTGQELEHADVRRVWDELQPIEREGHIASAKAVISEYKEVM